MYTAEQVAAVIDHTLLRADAGAGEYSKLCAEAREYRFASVCVPPAWVAFCAAELRGSGIPVCTVVGFPLGYSLAAVKADETRRAVDDGADEIDTVINVGYLKSGMINEVRNDITAVVNAAGGKLVKVIIETCLLTDDEKRLVCGLCREAGTQFVKTSTGFSSAGATADDVALMKAAAGGLLVKAAGGIRTTEDALAMLRAGADRIGASKSIEIIAGLPC